MPLGDTVAPPRETTVGGTPHMLAYINEDEARLLRARGGGVAEDGGQIMGPAGVPAFDEGAGDGGGPGGDSQDTILGGAIQPSLREAQAAEQRAAAQARTQRINDDRNSATAALRARFNELYTDDRFNQRAARAATIGDDRLESLRSTEINNSIARLDPELRASPLANTLARGINEQAAAARANARTALANANAATRSGASNDLGARIARLSASDDPLSAYGEESAGLDGFSSSVGELGAGEYGFSGFSSESAPATAYSVSNDADAQRAATWTDSLFAGTGGASSRTIS